MPTIDHREDPVATYDIVICGGGIAGLWLLNLLVNAGFSVLLVERDVLGGTQTIASQGMIHGGQRYMLGADSASHAGSVAPLPDRWDACLAGFGDIDLREVRVLSATQVMWPAGGPLAHLALISAAQTFKAKTRKLDAREVPKALNSAGCAPVYELPEKVLDIASLVKVLSARHVDHIRRGSVDTITREGFLTVSGLQIKAQLVICAAGLGNEALLSRLEAGEDCSQRRPLRQLMVKCMPFPLYGHGITVGYRPRVTVTSHPLSSGGYVWYLGGALADSTCSLSNDEAIAFAQKEMKALFGHLYWNGKEWATWYGVRAEPNGPSGRLPSGPVVRDYGNVLVVWPTKLTLAPLLGDRVLAYIEKKGFRPRRAGSLSPPLGLARPRIAPFPWDSADWVS
jgi:glycine/D-amino acid oxidase-like deaminating enzyme